VKKYIIAAMTRTMVIGRENAIPWHLPEELRLFRKLTLGGTVIMGRRTFQSIGRPLPGRHNIVLSRQLRKEAGIEICRNFTDALRTAEHLGETIFFIGGAEVFRMALPLVDGLHISWIHEDCQGDTYFPDFAEAEWAIAERSEHEGFTYIFYQRKVKTR
jgi:dihydrofolate reductase